MPQHQEQGLSQEQKTKINRILLLERAGKLSPEQQTKVDELRKLGAIPAKMEPEKPPMRGGTSIKAGIPAGFGPPEQANPLEAIPPAGAILGATLGAPAGLGGALGGAALGGGGGEAAKQLISRAIGAEAPETSGEAFEDILTEGALQATLEGGMRGVIAGGKFVLKRLGKRIPVKEAAEKLSAKLFGNEVTPKQFGDDLKALYDTTRDAADSELRAFKDTLVKNSPNLNVPYNKSLDAVNRRIAQLRADMSKHPRRAKVDPTTGKDTRQMAIDELTDLQQLFGNQNVLKRGNLNEAFSERTRAFKLSQVVKGEAEGFETELSNAIHDDIGVALKANGKTKEFGEFELLSRQFRRVKELGEKEKSQQLAKVFGDERVSSEQVGKILADVPEESLAAVRLLKGDRQAVKSVRQAIFENLVESNKLGKTNSKIVREVFGQEAEKVLKFGDLMARAERGEGLAGALRFIATTVAGTRFGLNVPGSGIILEMRARDLARLLDQPNGLNIVIDALEKPATKATASNLLRLIEVAGNQPVKRKGATIEERMTPEQRRTMLEQRGRLAGQQQFRPQE